MNNIKNFKEVFTEVFTLLAWISLLSFIMWCTANNIKTDSIRDAWTILVLIAGFIWGSKHERSKQQGLQGTTTTEVNLTSTTTPIEDEKAK